MYYQKKGDGMALVTVVVDGQKKVVSTAEATLLRAANLLKEEGVLEIPPEHERPLDENHRPLSGYATKRRIKLLAKTVTSTVSAILDDKYRSLV